MNQPEEAHLEAMITSTLEEIISHADELTALDQAIGDGDHGINMKRGAEKILSEISEISSKPFDEALKSMGMALVMSVGGASGPLFGTLLMEMGNHWGSRETTRKTLIECFAAGIEAVKKRGRSDVGQKTMLDVLAPALEVILQNEVGPDLFSRLKETVAESEERTIDMIALKGRASYLGERSIGHMDPGARTSGLAIRKLCEILEAIHNES